MKGIVLFCFLASTAALTIPARNSLPRNLFSACLGRLSNDDPIANLRKDNKAVTVSPDDDCKQLMLEGSTDVDARNLRFNPFDNACLMGIRNYPKPTDKQVSLYRDKPDGSLPRYVSACTREKDHLAYYLPYEENKNTFMILDPAKASWFFTSPLGGCDIFVATNPNNKPLLIHANANAVGNDMAANLKLKGDDANKIIQANDGYNLVARIYAARPGTDLGAYYETRRPRVQLCTYNTALPKEQKFYFIGHYEATVGAWEFFLKGEFTGKITKLSEC